MVVIDTSTVHIQSVISSANGIVLAVTSFAVICGSILGCASPMTSSPLASARQLAAPPNPFLLPVGTSPQSFETTWERCIDVLHQYKFVIERENRPAGTIETEYKVGAGILEPWHHDSVNAAARLESTFQSIRRRVIVRIIPDDDGAGYLVGIEALKEREDLASEVENTRGGGTFNEYSIDQNRYSRGIDDSSPSGWIPLGHDIALERAIITSLQHELTR